MDRAWQTLFDSAGTLIQNLAQTQRSGQERSLKSAIASMTIHNLVAVLFSYGQGKFQLEENVPSTHSLSLTQAVLSMLDHIAIVAFTPRILLSL